MQFEKAINNNDHKFTWKLKYKSGNDTSKPANIKLNNDNSAFVGFSEPLSSMKKHLGEKELVIPNWLNWIPRISFQEAWWNARGNQNSDEKDSIWY